MRILGDLNGRIERLPAAEIDEAADENHGREIPVEQVVERLIQMTPERLIDRTGPGVCDGPSTAIFVCSIFP